MNKEQIKKRLIQYLFIALGVILLDFGFYFFTNPAKLVFGGMLGVSVLLEPYYSKLGVWFTSSIFLWIANGITLIIGGIMLGKDFFLKTIFSTVFSPLVVFIFERTCDPNFFMKDVSLGGYYPIAIICSIVTSGLGLGLALKNNGSTGGMDVIQKILSKYFHIPYSKTMYFTDWVIVIASGFVFQSTFSYHIEIVIYGIVGVYGISLIIDMIVLRAKVRRTAYIITEKPEEIRDFIYAKTDRGVTFVEAYGGYTGNKKTMVVCTMEKNEAYKITESLGEIDPHAFCYVSTTREIVGDYL
ncbi:MAG: YitT family protein [Anaeroplasmataceae bacterium]|nr:YitT family protein [Anaeroplasmataceae bacterium]